jgi:LacI family transcriptional regulator
MRVSIAELGGLALSRLLLAIDTDGADKTVPETLVPELIVRASTLQSNLHRPVAGNS